MKLRVVYFACLLGAAGAVGLCYRLFTTTILFPAFPYGSGIFFTISFGLAIVSLFAIASFELKLWKGYFGDSSARGMAPPIPIAIGVAVGFMSGLSLGP